MESVKVVYGIKDDLLKKKRGKNLSLIELIKRKRRLRAAKALLGIWADKDTTFFDKD